MKVWNGNIKDITNFTTDEFLKVNSCGFQNVGVKFKVVRENGRKDYHFLLILSGKCEAVHNGRHVNLSAGGLVIYEPFEAQVYSFSKNCTSLWCHFSGTAVEEIFESCSIKGGIYATAFNKDLADTFTALVQKFNIQGNEKFATPCLLELIYKIGNEISKDDSSAKISALSPVLSYINANYNKQLSLSELAKISGYSMSRFSHLFSEITGTTPIKYQNSIRLKLAREMLTSTALSVSDIAYAIGFNDPLYFSRTFKKEYGIPPTKYKKA